MMMQSIATQKWWYGEACILSSPITQKCLAAQPDKRQSKKICIVFREVSYLPLRILRIPKRFPSSQSCRSIWFPTVWTTLRCKQRNAQRLNTTESAQMYHRSSFHFSQGKTWCRTNTWFAFREGTLDDKWYLCFTSCLNYSAPETFIPPASIW